MKQKHTCIAIICFKTKANCQFQLFFFENGSTKLFLTTIKQILQHIPEQLFYLEIFTYLLNTKHKFQIQMTRNKIIVTRSSTSYETQFYSLFAEDNLSGSTEVLSGLIGTLVRASLQADDGLAGSQLLFGPITFMLFGRSRPQPGTPPFGMFVGRSADSENRRGHQSDVLYVPQIGRLEQINFRYPISDAGFLEPETQITC